MNQPYIYIASLLDFLPIQVTTVRSIEFPALYSVFLLVTCFMHSINSVYVSIPIAQFLTFLSGPLKHVHEKKSLVPLAELFTDVCMMDDFSLPKRLFLQDSLFPL